MVVTHRGRKNKGSKAERDLIHLFWDNGFAAVRAAGSGSSQHPCPDVIAGNGRLFFALECKSCRAASKYLPQDEITQLDLFSNIFGARPFIAIKFDKEEWRFIRLSDLKATKKSYSVNRALAMEKGILFQDMIKMMDKQNSLI